MVNHPFTEAAEHRVAQLEEQLAEAHAAIDGEGETARPEAEGFYVSEDENDITPVIH